MDFSKLLRLENKNKFSEELEKVSLEGREDIEIRKIIVENFPNLFPHLELFNKGNQHTIPIFKRNKRPDSLAFCESEKRLYIFEYKSKIDEDLIKQVREYRDGLQKEDIKLYALLENWNEQTKKFRKLEDFKNNKAKIICIAPEFDDYAIGVEEKWEEEIYLIKITKYKDKKSSFILLQTREVNFEILNSSISTNNNVKGLPKRPWLDKLKEWVIREIEPLAIDSSLIKNTGRGGGKWNFGKVNQETDFSIAFRSQYSYLLKPKIFLVNPSEFLIKKWQLEGPNEKGSHFFYVETKSNDGWLKAKQLIAEFIKGKN